MFPGVSDNDPYHNAVSVQDCQAFCATQLTCAGVVMPSHIVHVHGSSLQAQGSCHMKTEISLGDCGKGDSYDTYMPDKTRRLWDHLQRAFSLVGAFVGSGSAPGLALAAARGGALFGAIFAALAVWRRSRRGNWVTLLAHE